MTSVEAMDRALTLDMGKTIWIRFSIYVRNSCAFSDEGLAGINVQLDGMRDRGKAWHNPTLLLGIDADGSKVRS